MSRSDQLTPGDVARDAEQEGASIVLVFSVTNIPCNEFTTNDYDWQMNEMTVADYESNAAYPVDDPVVGGMYVESLVDSEIEWRTMELCEVQEEADAAGVRTWHFPLSRLTRVRAEDVL